MTWSDSQETLPNPIGWIGQTKPTMPGRVGWQSAIEKVVSITDHTYAMAILTAIINAKMIAKVDFALDIGQVESDAEAILKTWAESTARPIMSGQASSSTLARMAFGVFVSGTMNVSGAASARASLIAAAKDLTTAKSTILAHMSGKAIDYTAIGSKVAFASQTDDYQMFTTPGTYTYWIPPWSNYVYSAGIGGGASGQTGSGVAGGKGSGGQAGVWGEIEYKRGVDIPWSVSTITITVGPGGAKSPNSDYGGPNWGYKSSILIPEAGGIGFQFNGGSGTVSGQNGQSAPWFKGLSGGEGGTGNGGAGSSPGGGGAGGNGGILGNRTKGGAGGNGFIYMRSGQ